MNKYQDEGYEAAMLEGSHGVRCPYDEASDEGFNWLCGYYDGLEFLSNLNNDNDGFGHGYIWENEQH